MIEEEADESPDEMRRMLHELRVHQIELEMQNEELRLIQMELEVSRAHYFDLYDLAPIGYLTLSEKGLILQANITAANLLGLVRSAMIKQPITRFVFNEDQDIYYLYRKQFIKIGEPQTCELRMVKSDGTPVWVHQTVTASQDVDGTPIFLCVLNDINDRKQVEVTLQESEVFKQAILNSVVAEIAVLNRDGIILEVNEPWRRFSLENGIKFGNRSAGNDVGANYLGVCQEAGTDFLAEGALDSLGGIRAVLDGRLPSFSLEYPCHSPQRQRWFSMNVTPLGKAAQSGVVITHTDITARKQAENTTFMAKQQLESMTAAVPGVVYQLVRTAAGEWQFLYLSKGIEDLYEVAAEQAFVDFNLLTRCMLKEDQASHQEAVERLAKNPNKWEQEYRIRTPSGKVKWVQNRANPKKQANGNILWSGILTDISEQKHAEAEVRDREHRYRALLQDASDTILITDLKGNIEEINRAGELLLGYGQNEISGMNMTQIHAVSEMIKVAQRLKDIATNGSILPVETKVMRKHGQIVDVEIRSTLIDVAGRKMVQGIIIDLTERKNIEKKRLATENELRNVLVREVHHRIKNNLQGITGILRQFAQTHTETATSINQAISQVQSISVIHGLQGRAVTSSVRACELTVAIAAGIESLWQKPIIVEIPDGWIPCTITETEAVPLALVLNELISNAVKHSATDEYVSIKLSHEPGNGSIKLTIHNTGLISAGFGLEDTTGFSTGLQLVASLLPRAGARLSWAQQDGIVTTTLGLDEPVIQLESLIKLNAHDL